MNFLTGWFAVRSLGRVSAWPNFGLFYLWFTLSLIHTFLFHFDFTIQIIRKENEYRSSLLYHHSSPDIQQSQINLL